MKLRLIYTAPVLLGLFFCNAPAAVLYVDLNSTNSTPPYANWSTAASDIQSAIDVSSDGDQIMVNDGIYQTGGRAVYGSLTNRVVINKAVSVQSVHGPSVTTILGNPVIGDSAVRCVYMTNNAALIGFTVTQGATRNFQGDMFLEWPGGGIWCESTNAVMSNCVITANSAANGGGGVYGGTLEGCILSSNTTIMNYVDGDAGGGAVLSTLDHCLLLGNSSAAGGGGAASCTLSFCVLAGNFAFNGTDGGGAAGCTLNNCIITNNWTPANGGGVASCTLNNCTVVGNSAGNVGGAYNSTVNNCIVYYNQCSISFPNYEGSGMNFCCTTPFAGGNNFTNEPNFVDLANGNLHVKSPSFCINGGDNSTVTTAVDMDGNPRIVGTYVDVGAYEYQSPAPNPLGATLQAAYTNFAAGLPVIFSGAIAGHETLSIWDFGDGTTVSNTLNVSHAWSAPGPNLVTFTAYNGDYPGGVSASILVYPLSNPTCYVALGNPNPVWPYVSWATAATNIQDAVDAAVVGGAVVVSNGLYQTGARLFGLTTNRVTVTNILHLQSVNGPGVTTIQGYQTPGVTNGSSSIRCVFLASGATLSGFTLTNGSTTVNVVGDGGGIVCGGMDSIVSNCVLVGNSSSRLSGGGHSGTYNNCVIGGNSSPDGGGIGVGVLNNCLVLSNSASANGGGIYNAQATNCTFIGNYAGAGGGGAYGGAVANCILVNNLIGTNNPTGTNVLNGNATYCSSTPLLSGPGNITNAPVFVNPSAGNYRLQTGSPGIDAGNNAYAPVGPDLDGNPRIVGSSVDMGAYENQNTSPVHFVSVGNASPVTPYTNWLTAATNIQDALAVAKPGEIVIVNRGSYGIGGTVIYGQETNRVALTNGTTVLGLYGPQATLIVGGPQLRCAYVGSNSLLSGFTLTNGQARTTGDVTNEQSGGGAWCQTGGIISNCFVTRNISSSSFNGGRGGGIYGGGIWNSTIATNTAYYGGGVASASVFNCMIVSNSTAVSGSAGGGGAYSSSLSNCVLIANGGDGNGGGAYNCVLTGSVLSNNSSAYFGGGAYSSALVNCTVFGNSAGDGGGSYLGTLTNCLVCSNSASYGGGGDQSSFYNCTVVNNKATYQGGGVSGQTGASAAVNCILYYNNAPAGSNYDSNVPLNYCCASPLPAGGARNIANIPLFVNVTNDFHLQSTSPCINSGNNAYVANGTDLDGNLRIAGGTVDIGAYEYQAPTSIISYGWLQQFGLPTDGSADFSDPDGDGMSNWQEWKAGTNPTNAASVLVLLAPATGVSGVTVTWKSVSGVTYYLQRSGNLFGKPAFTVIQSNIPGQAGTTSYTDAGATNGVAFYYRVGVQ